MEDLFPMQNKDTSDLPSVGIGLPVYNNERYLSLTLDSLLNQTYTNITIYLSDDCSDDSTAQICELYAKKDKRIRYSREEKNIGAFKNHLKIRALASTDYFLFVRGHELLSPTVIEDGVNVLKNEKDVVLAFATPVWIDEENKIMEHKPFGYYDTRGVDVVIRSAYALWGRPEYFHGIMRTETVKNLNLDKGFPFNDALTMLELALLGSFAHTFSSTRFRRYNYQTETYKKRLKRNRKLYYSISRFDYILPYVRIPYFLFRAIQRSKISFSDKIKIFLVVFFTAPLRFLASRGKQL